MNRLVDCITEYETIAVTGLCKNAGKTTAVNNIVDELHNDFRLGLTSIGYDGEEKDEITLLEKPRIMVYKGMVAATCEQCLEKSDISHTLLEKTGINYEIIKGCGHIINYEKPEEINRLIMEFLL